MTGWEVWQDRVVEGACSQVATIASGDRSRGNQDVQMTRLGWLALSLNLAPAALFGGTPKVELKPHLLTEIAAPKKWLTTTITIRIPVININRSIAIVPSTQSIKATRWRGDFQVG